VSTSRTPLALPLSLIFAASVTITLASPLVVATLP
jgi:hypothetical protein